MIRHNPRHADVVLASIEGTYHLPLRRPPLARFLVAYGEPEPRPDLLTVLSQTVLTATNTAALERDAADTLPPGLFAVYETDGQAIVSGSTLRMT